MTKARLLIQTRAACTIDKFDTFMWRHLPESLWNYLIKTNNWNGIYRLLNKKKRMRPQTFRKSNTINMCKSL